MRPTEIRQDIKAEVLRQTAKLEKDGGMCRRLLGIAHLLEGGSRSECHKISCLTVNTFRMWIQRFNRGGIEGLRSKKQTGRPCKLTTEVEQALRAKVLQGPSEKEGLVRYRLVDLQKFLKEEHNVSMGESGIWYVLQSLGLSWKTGRQRHPKSDGEAQEAFKKTLLSS